MFGATALVATVLSASAAGVPATGSTVRMSVTSGGAEGKGQSSGASLSAEGRLVAFNSSASLVSEDDDGSLDVYVRDMARSSTEIVSVAPDGAQIAAETALIGMTTDGRSVFFRVSEGSNSWSRITYLMAGEDVTRAVVSGTFETAELPPGEAVRIKTRVHVRRGTAECTGRRLPFSTSSKTSTWSDFVATGIWVPCSIRQRGSDPWGPLWRRTLGQEIVAVATDGAGDVYVTGAVDSPDGYWKTMVVAKYAGDGDRLWKRVWHQHSERYPYSVGSDIAVSPDTTAVYVGGAEFNDSTEEAKARLWAYSADGHLEWTRVGWPGRSVQITAVAANDDGAIVGGTTHGECGWPHDGQLAAFEEQGERLWTDPFEAPGYEGTSDVIEGLAVGPRGQIYAVGTTETEPVSCDDAMLGIWSDQNIVIQELSSDGEVGWTRTLVDPYVKDRERALDVDIVGDQVVVAGQIDATQRGIGRAWLGSFSITGHARWSTTWGPARHVSSSAVGVSASAWGPLYATGSIGHALFLRSFSLAGSLLTERRLKGPHATGVATGPRRGLYVTGGPYLWRVPAQAQR